LEQPGLRLRLRSELRRISAQHRRLDGLLGRVFETLDGGSVEELRGALESFCDAFEAHTRMEDEIHFPALRAELAGAVETLSAEHRQFREDFVRLEARLAAGDLAGFAKLLDALGAQIADHELREETLLPGPTAGADR
jgi:hypothetical protein